MKQIPDRYPSPYVDPRDEKPMTKEEKEKSDEADRTAYDRFVAEEIRAERNADLCEMRELQREQRPW